MIEAVEVPAGGRLLINSYGGGGFVVNGLRCTGAQIVFPDRVIAWSGMTFSDISKETLEPVLNAEPAVPLLLIGCGSLSFQLDGGIRQFLRERGVGVETMNTQAACRTFNLLMGEGRLAAALVIPIS